MPDEVTNLEDRTGSVVLSQELIHLRKDVAHLVRHTIVLVLTLVSISLGHITLSFFLEKDAAFFDVIPIRYVIHVADICALGKFVWHAIKDFQK